MFTFHRYAQANSKLKDKVAFHPTKDGATDDSSRLLRIIGYSQCLDFSVFLRTIGRFLHSTNLSSI